MTESRDGVTRYHMRDRRRINLLAEGRGEELAPGLYAVLDREVACRKLDTLDAAVDGFIDRQREHYEDWEHADSAFRRALRNDQSRLFSG